jgi:hypothetical protein
MRVRAFARREHAAQIVNWQERFEETVQHANRVLEPALGIQLEVMPGAAWAAAGEAEELQSLLEALQSAQRDDEADWIVGLAGALSRLEPSFHQLGMARVGGRHMVLRAPNDALEYDAIQRALPDLGEDERSALYRSRRAHQAAAVFVHELGHALGAVHVRTKTDLMYPFYSIEMASLAEPVADLMRVSLRHLAVPPAQREQSLLARSLLDALAQSRAPWVSEEKAELEAYLRQLASSNTALASPVSATLVSASAPHPEAESAPPSAAASGAIESLPEAERAMYYKVLQHKQAGRVEEAWAEGQPLFDAFSDNYAIAELRCQPAMDRQLGWEQARAECRPLMERSTGFRKK